MTFERKKKFVVGLGFICAMILCLIFSHRHGPHRGTFDLAFLILAMTSTWLSYQSTSSRQPDNLIHLFPVQSETSKERS